MIRAATKPLRLLAILIATWLLVVAPAPAEAGSKLEVGVGRADITPTTGGFKGGWANSEARVLGQHTRLYARAIVLERNGRKLAIVVEDLAFLSAGMVRDAAAIVAGRGFSEQNVIASATHTHGSQTGFMNFPTFNSVLPGTGDPTEFDIADTAADPVMYGFMTRQLAAAIRRADDDLGPGAVGWSKARLLGVTQNRSLEAHLHNFGVKEPPGAGSVAQDPRGYAGTIDPAVDVLRVDKIIRGRHVPVGLYSTFANHGAVVKPTFPYFSADHAGAAERVVESRIRRAGRVPPGQEVVNAFANGDAGDQTAGIEHSGPAEAEWVGRREAAAMMRAWRAAGRKMTRRPRLAQRWTRVCFCGQQTAEGPIDSEPVIGVAGGAGSEELRTIFYDAGLAREGATLPAPVGPQGYKVPAVNQKGREPQAVPLSVARIGDRLIAALPVEPTVGAGKLIRDAIAAAARGAGIERVVVAGYAGDYSHYLTTPREYDRQHYEGGFTVWGTNTALFYREELVRLAQRLLSGEPAPDPYDYDSNNGVHATAAPYPRGAADGAAEAEPGDVARLGHTAFAWRGGPDGIDRPVDRPYVTVQRLVGGGWRRAADDLGLEIVWSADADGRYEARWEVPRSAPAGAYRFRVTAKRYRLDSRRFQVRRGALLTPTVAGRAVKLLYPKAFEDNDWTYRPRAARGGTITFLVDSQRRVVHRRRASAFPIPPGRHVVIPAGGARDRNRNRNPTAITVR